jgi:hypothetical protein
MQPHLVIFLPVGGGLEKRKDWLTGLSCSIIFCLIIFSGCATKETVKSLSDEEVLRERVMAYWNYRVSRELDKAYAYEYPLGKTDLTKYVQVNSNPMMGYKSYEIKTIREKDEVADVELLIVPWVKVPGAKPLEHATTITDRWVKLEKVWYHVSRSPTEGFTQKKEKGGDVKD